MLRTDGRRLTDKWGLALLGFAAVVLASACGMLERGERPAPGEAPPELPFAAVREVITFDSPALRRSMQATVYLPPAYAAGDERYPVLYVLHGLGGDRGEWEKYRIFEQAAGMMAQGETPPFIIVLPEGEDGYWFNHANGGPQWGDYMAQDVVHAIDERYRTLTDRDFRGIGGLSMGADGALQLAMNNPEVFGIVQVHGPVLRPYEQAFAYYGNREHFDANYPISLVRARPDVAHSLRIELDVGDVDLWLANALGLHEELVALDIPHEFHLWTGGHDWDYWEAHIPDNLRGFDGAVKAALSQRQ